ncbi:uncharacterized protein LOC113315735 [Papaver somniferum]|uniref:uncharacterized protein LOC113315735 n=1 Tax=Papaver somniferum TaxID=3469 RepID=UPI000E704C0E|nr:uncharacterized protein LOC113315735 [Papaver somniferum]
MSIYKWPKKVVHACERIIRNYLWSGNAEDKKCITLKWDKVCTSTEEGGLGIRKLEDLNKALLMKFLWKMLHSNDEWAKFFLAKYTDRNGNWISFYKRSFVWPGIRWVIQEFNELTRWSVGDDNKISLWHDRWIYEEPISYLFPNHNFINQNSHQLVSSLIVNGKWCIPEDFLQFIQIEQLPVIREGADMLVWCNSIFSKFIVSDAITKISSHMPKHHWYKNIWNVAVLPSTAENICVDGDLLLLLIMLACENSYFLLLVYAVWELGFCSILNIDDGFGMTVLRLQL